MKRLLLLLFTSPAFASPFVVSDPLTAGVTHCGLYLDSAAKVEVPVAKDANNASICKFDLASVSTGSHSLKATAIIKDPVWGNQESVQTAPLAFVRPASPPTPAGLTLTP